MRGFARPHYTWCVASPNISVRQKNGRHTPGLSHGTARDTGHRLLPVTSIPYGAGARTQGGRATGIAQAHLKVEAACTIAECTYPNCRVGGWEILFLIS